MPEDGKRALLERRVLPGRDVRADSVIDVVATSAVGSTPLRAYWDILWKRRWEILATVSIVSTIVAIYSFRMRPIYEAIARVEIDAEVPQIQSLNEFYQTNTYADGTFLKTQVQVLESDTLAWQTIQQLRLVRNPDFTPAGEGSAEPAAGPATQGPLLRKFRERLRVTLTPDSRMVQVRFESTQPEVAARVVNTLVSDYVEYNFRMKYDATRQASGWMEQQLDELKAKVEKSQQALVDYERQKAIVNVSDKQNVAEQRLEDLSRDLTNAENDLSQKESLYDLVQANKAEVALLTQNELLQRLEEKYADLKAQYVDALGQYGPNFPKVMRLRDQVNEIESLIRQERERTVSRIRNDYAAALGRDRLLAAAVAQQKGKVGELNQLLIQHNILKRDFDTNQQLYDSLLQRLKDATISAGLRATNIHVVDTASIPTIPVRPKKAFNQAIGLMVGLLLGITLAFIEEGLDYSVKTTEDVEALVNLPSLAVIPAVGTLGARPYRLAKYSSSGNGNASIALAALKEPSSAIAEAYRTLRTAILFSTAPSPPQTLLVTSSQPREGKTCTSLNLGLALAQRGARVVIVDADLRKPGIASALHLPDERGLSGVLTGAYRLQEALAQIEAAPNLWILPSGPRPPNPAELLSSSTMEKVVGELREHFDQVVLDSPPLLMVTDATVLSAMVDGVMLVVESGVTTRAALVHACRILRTAGGRVLGVVINKLNLRQDGYYYGFRHNGYHYYSDDHVAAAKADESALAPSRANSNQG